MSYQRFAYVYDVLMEDAPYDEWLQFTKEKLASYQVPHILDVGCGTGQFILKLKNAGYDVSGVDLSANMLAIANEKIMEQGHSVRLFEQDMRYLENIGTFDAVTVFCDSLNYLQTEEDVKKSLFNFYSILRSGGQLLFDIHSIYKMESIFKDQTFTYDSEEVAYIWQSFEGEHPFSVEHELTFFVREENELYRKFQEWHEQRTFPIEDYERWLKEAGFTNITIEADFSKKVTETSERIFFTAQKK
ncbi:class I SAM-dependent DNA methyltransferase [Alkalihalobacterium bogoriense]|uniref:class I SAM-dependent DNA methyltransferase n=1 Tax=Alkalihalobacterium bogoriense TaxID=246272 RepID=UPI00047AC17C|nr:class I SAM-dependent methyltransferase [Alkalihalobacterium bogoriense]